MRHLGAVDRGLVVVALLLGGAFVAFLALPFAGLFERAARDGDTFDLATSDQARTALFLSLWTSTLALVLAVAGGTPIAYLLARSRFPGRSVVDGLISLPIVLPPTVAGVALLTAFGRRGLLGEPLEDWTGIAFSFTTTAVVMAQLLVSAPFYIQAARAGFERADVQQERVAFTLGASRARTFLRITVPQVWPALVAGMVLCWARSMGELGATLIFAGNLEGRTQTMPLAIIGAFEGSSLGLAGAIAYSLVLLVVAIAVLALFRAITSRAGGAP